MSLIVYISKSEHLLALVESGVNNAVIRWQGSRGYDFPIAILDHVPRRSKLKFDVGSITQIGGINMLASRIGWSRLILEEPSDLPAKYLAYAAGLPGLSSPKDYRKMIAYPKIDTHWHTGKWGIGIEPRTQPMNLSDDIRKFGIRIALTSSITALDGDLHLGNAETASFCKRDPRVFGLVVVNPLQVASSITQINKYKHLFVGIKTIQDEIEGGLMHPGYREIFKSLPEGWPVMAHLGGLKETIQEFPHLTFIAAHSTWDWKPLIPLKNVYFDIATSARHDLTELIDQAPDRVIFSSDAPLVSPAFTLGKLGHLNLPEMVLRKIYTLNALEVFPKLRSKIGLLAG